MAYSRIKVWIAAEVLTASDLNNEHNGHITNENDLDTRLISEISSRSTLETEYNAFYGACWNAGSSEIAANRVSNNSMKDNSVGFTELKAECDDPAAGTAGLRSLGTTAIKACAGNDSRLSDQRTPSAHSVNFTKIEHGSVMLPFCDADSGTEYDDAHDTWTTMITFRIYIPTNATTIRMASRQKGSSTGGWSGYLRFKIGSSNSGESICNSDSYEWRTDATLDVSALGGWYDLSIQLHKSGSAHSYLQGYSFVWE